MESSEQNFSIDHFEEKFVTFSPVLEKANDEDASGSETVKTEEVDGASEKAIAEIESGVNKTDEVLPQEKNVVNTLTNEMVGSQATKNEKIEIVMGVQQTIDVEQAAKEANQVKNGQDMNPESPEKSEVNLFIGVKESGQDQSLNVESKGENLTSEVGRPADKEQILNVCLGTKQKEIDIEYPSPVFRSEIEKPSMPIDLEAKQENKLGSNYQASTSIFVKSSDDAQSIQKEQSAVTESIQKEQGAVSESIQKEQGAIAESVQKEQGAVAELIQKEQGAVAELIQKEQGAVAELIQKEQGAVGESIQKVQSVVTESIQKVQGAVTEPLQKLQGAVTEPLQKVQSAISGSASSQCHPIEVERKFQVTKFDENKLVEANGKLISEVSFEDVYFDNNSYDLILNDCWLRKRNQQWEFKIPVNRNPNLLYMSTQFQELENEKDIRAALHEIIKPEAKISESQGIIEEFKLNPFATFTTTRKSYKLPSDCTVVIDFTSFGYSVGEIEMMVKDNSEVGEAIDKINTIAGQLGFQMLSITELAKC